MADNLIKLADEQCDDNTKVEKETQSQLLIRLAADVELFHSTEREPFATFKVNDHYETWPLKGEGFKLWLTKRFYEEYGKVAGGQGLSDAFNVLRAKALFEGEKRNVFTRIAEKDNEIYIDLCNETKQFINFKNESDWILIVAWLLGTFKSASPFPILTIQGEQGSAKSTTTRVLRSMVDPSAMPLRGLPKEERDLSIAANNTWVLAFDNLSGLSNIMSDALCKLSTGGGLATRRLYSDDDETVFNIMRPSILNGIDDIAKRQDLLDRSLVLFLPAISEEKRTDERTFWNTFKKAQPRILGALLDVIKEAVRELPNTQLKNKPRMADFVQWVTAAEKALNWNTGEFINAYKRNRTEAIDQGLDSDPIGVAVQAFMKDQNIWEGTATETLSRLSRYTDDEKTSISKVWPSSRKLKERLRRIAPALRTKGIEYQDLGRTKRGATLRIEKVEDISSLSTLSTQITLNQQSAVKDKVTINFNGREEGEENDVFS